MKRLTATIGLLLLMAGTGAILSVSMVPTKNFLSGDTKPFGEESLPLSPRLSEGTWILHLPDTKLSQVPSYYGEFAGDAAGCAVACAGDVNGDGYDDFLVGAFQSDLFGAGAGQAHLFLGRPTGWRVNDALYTADLSFYGEAAGDYAGWSVAGAGDVNGDGYDDFVISAYGRDIPYTNGGRVYLILGSATIASSGPRHMSLATASAYWWGISNDFAGASVAGVGDVNGDHYDDILIGANGGGGFPGKAYLICGNASIGDGSSIDADIRTANATFIGEVNGDYAGHCVAGIGDVNGDSYDDMLIGAPEHGGSYRGKAYLVLGNATIGAGCAISMPLSLANASFIPETAFNYLGSTMAGGDMNGDGFSDLLFGAPYMNGNKAYLVLGNGSIGDGSAKNMPLSAADAWFNGENAADQAGVSVACPGDLNKDGYDDMLIGATDNDEGGVNAGQTYLVLGNASIGNGCAKGMSLSAAAASFIGENAGNKAGEAVSGAGDVDGDGHLDLLVGAMDYSGEGANSGKAYLILAETHLESCPADISYEFGILGNIIVWNVSDSCVNSPNYTIFVDDAPSPLHTESAWTSNLPVKFSADGLAVGSHNICIIARDGLGHMVQDNIAVTVINNPPTFASHPGDTRFIQGTKGHIITWNVTDASVYNPHYTVLVNGNPLTGYIEQAWYSGANITVIVDSLVAGEYNVTLIAHDGLTHIAQDEVLVEVIGLDSEFNGGIDGAPIAGLCTCAIVGLSVILYRVRKNRAIP